MSQLYKISKYHERLKGFGVKKINGKALHDCTLKELKIAVLKAKEGKK